jgi:RNA polymerase sigma-70 factor (ECF subfamily)
VENSRAWLTAVVSRLAIDRLRRLQLERVHYPGEWLPEPWLDEPASESAEDAALRNADLSYALLVLLERLNPVERTAFVLHEALDYDYRDIAPIIDKSEVNVRQIVHRARARLRTEGGPLLEPAQRASLLQRLADSVLRRDSAAIAGLLTTQAEFHGDGGGKVAAVKKPLCGNDAVARFLLAVAGNSPGQLAAQELHVETGPALAWTVDGKLASIMSVEPGPAGAAQIGSIYNVANPDKLEQLARHLGLPLLYAEQAKPVS